MDLKKTGNFISSVRKARGMTQKELASRLQVSDRAVSKWERGVPKLKDTTPKPTLTLFPNNNSLSESRGIVNAVNRT